MANIGLEYLVCAKLKETNPPNKTVNYSEGRVLSKLISAGVSTKISDVKLYADNKLVENIKEVRPDRVLLGVV